MHQVAVLFARKNSVYKGFEFADVFDEVRDARNYSGVLPVVAHPPCRGWGRLRTFAKVVEGELDLALFAVENVRKLGGVLEHPASSKLWVAAGLPRPGQVDAFGGFTYVVFQSWFGHRAPKPTWLYIVGITAAQLPAVPFEFGIPPGRVNNMATPERERTPPTLCSVAVGCSGQV